MVSSALTIPRALSLRCSSQSSLVLSVWGRLPPVLMLLPMHEEQLTWSLTLLITWVKAYLFGHLENLRIYVKNWKWNVAWNKMNIPYKLFRKKISCNTIHACIHTCTCIRMYTQVPCTYTPTHPHAYTHHTFTVGLLTWTRLCYSRFYF